jgi:hypothetical protein
MIAEHEREVRRPWTPGCLQQHGFDAQRVVALSYVVIDEIIDDVVGLAISDWPAADGAGRVRFDHPEAEVEVGVPLERLDDELYEGRLERDPRVGDVFAATMTAAGRSRMAAGLEVWDEPLAGLLGETVYDLSREARKVAKLAFFGAMAPIVGQRAAEEWRLLEVAEVDDEPATVIRVASYRGS